MSARIKHSGIVEDITGNHVRVRITGQAACIGCQVAGHCETAGRKDKIIDVYNAPSTCAVGQTVMVSVSTRSGLEAVAMAFGLPFVLLVVCALLCTILTGSEAIGALVGIAVLVPYYIVVYLMRNKIGRRLSFAIEDLP